MRLCFSRQHVVPEDTAPLRHQLIRRQQDAALLLAPGNELEEEVGTALLEGQVPELIVGILRERIQERCVQVERCVQRRAGDRDHRAGQCAKLRIFAPDRGPPSKALM